MNIFQYKCLVTPEQFFKYGFAEQKMLLCCDVINLVKRKHKLLGIKRSLSAKRTSISRHNDSGRVTLLSHGQGKQSSFYYERDTQKKQVNVTTLGSDLKPSGRASRNGSARMSRDFDVHNQLAGTGTFKPNESTVSLRTRSLEASERLTGSLAFQVPNRHRYCKGVHCENSKQRLESNAPENQEGQQAPSVLRHRGENKVDSKDFLPDEVNPEHNSRSNSNKQSGTEVTHVPSRDNRHHMNETRHPEHQPVTFNINAHASAHAAHATAHAAHTTAHGSKQSKHENQDIRNVIASKQGETHHDYRHHSQAEHVQQFGSKNQDAHALPADLVALLRDSILNLNQKFDSFNQTINEKIEKIERNYEDLSTKLDNLG